MLLHNEVHKRNRRLAAALLADLQNVILVGFDARAFLQRISNALNLVTCMVVERNEGMQVTQTLDNVFVF